MAEKSEKTEKPTSKRLDEARKQGQFPNSQELISAVSLIVLMATTFLMGPGLVDWAKELIRDGLSCDYNQVATPETFHELVNAKIVSTALILAPFLFALMVAGITVNIAISGFHIRSGGIKFNFNLIHPAKGFTQLISGDSLIKILFSIVKIIFVGSIVYFYLRDKIEYLATFQYLWTSQFLAELGKLILGAVFRLCIGLIIIGFVDLIYQKYKYIKNLMMTKKEVKDEQRDMDTPPEVRRKIRQKQFEASMRRMLQEVPKANVVIVNPTHVAVALRYDPDTMAAPVVVAKGADNMCEKIKEVARAYGVPVIRRPAIARSIYSAVDLGRPIPDNLFTAVAEILALVYRLKNRR